MEKLLWYILLLGAVAFTVQSDTLYFKPKDKCKWNGNFYDLNATDIPHPTNPCKKCKCCITGKVKCKWTDCPNAQPPPCGVKYRTMTDDIGCCERCNDVCLHYKNDNSTCSNCTGLRYYPEDISLDGCCGICGACSFRGHIVPPGNITNTHVAHPCEGCVCDDGLVTCHNRAKCPETKLNCVRPVIDEHLNCTWTCPNGPSCFKNDVELFANETRPFGQKFCFCLTHPIYWPLAVCANKGHEAKLEQYLQAEMCMKQPENPILWNDEE